MSKKTIWITGASSGIGKATAMKFAAEGWKVIISARRTELLNELSKNENIYSYPLDVTSAVNAKEVFNNIINDHGNVNLCIFSSGTYERKSEKELNVENIKHVMEVNFIGVIRLVQLVDIADTDWTWDLSSSYIYFYLYERLSVREDPLGAPTITSCLRICL